MKRVLICILTVTLLIGALAVPSYAAEINPLSDVRVNVMDYIYPNNGDSLTVNVGNNGTVVFDLPFYIRGSYVDILLYTGGSAVKTVSLNGTALNYVRYGDGSARIYGDIPSSRYKTFTFTFTTYGTSRLSFCYFDVVEETASVQSIVGTITSEHNGRTYSATMSSPTSSASVTVPHMAESANHSIYTSLSFADWRVYDYVSFSVAFTGFINSVTVNAGTNPVPFTITPIVSDFFWTDGSADDASVQYVIITIDCRDIDRLGAAPIISISSDISGNDVYDIRNSLLFVTGYKVSPAPDTLIYWLRNLFDQLSGLRSDNNTVVTTWGDAINNTLGGLGDLISGFRSDVNTVVTTWSDLINKSIESFKSSIVSTVTSWSDTINKSVGSVGSKIDNWGQQILDAIVGQKSDDTTVSDAIENQEQVNQEVNTQLQSAVGSWSDNVGEVTQGFNLALTNATPALIWISGMAQNVFSGMGWFGNIFFFLGFLHVFFLLMSKSGLGRAIDRADKRGDD